MLEFSSWKLEYKVDLSEQECVRGSPPPANEKAPSFNTQPL